MTEKQKKAMAEGRKRAYDERHAGEIPAEKKPRKEKAGLADPVIIGYTIGEGDKLVCPVFESERKGFKGTLYKTCAEARNSIKKGRRE